VQQHACFQALSFFVGLAHVLAFTTLFLAAPQEQQGCASTAAIE
jgi:hypothetical protein